MHRIHYFVSEDPSAPAGCQWRVARNTRVCLVCPNKVEAVAFAVSLARDDLAAARVAQVHIRERDAVHTVWTADDDPPAYPAAANS